MLLVGIIWVGTSLFASRELFHFVTSSEPEESIEVVVAVPHAPSRVDELGNSLSLSVGALGLSLLGAVVPVAKLLSYPLLAVSMAPVFRDSWANFRATKQINFTGLTALTTSLEVALGYNALAAFGWIVFTGGRSLQARTRRQAAVDLEHVFDEHGEHAWVVHEGVEIQVPIRAIAMSDRLIVRTGEPIPLDGTIVDGLIAVDQRGLSGESRLQELGVGDEVLAATRVLSGTAIIAPLRTGAATVAARVEALLAETESFEQRLRARAEVEADRSVRPTWAMIAVGWVTHGLPGVLAGFWTNCSDLLWFGGPYNVLNTVQAAARSSILIKDGRSLEQIAKIDTIVFDKTATSIDLAPQLRPDTVEILAKLRGRGLDIMLVTGDDDKERIVAELQAAGRSVCFVGDGLTDGLVLRRANVSISMTGSSFGAGETAQILLPAGSLEHLALVFELSDHFVHDQTLIVGTSRALTIVSSVSLMFMSLSLPSIVWMYTAGFGFTLVTSSLPRLRELNVPLQRRPRSSG
jgi:cation transport ATPase